MRLDDYLMRTIEQFGQLIAAMVGKLNDGSVDEAEQELTQAYDALLGGDRVFLEMVDAQTLAHLLGSPEKVRVLSRLSRVEARIRQHRGEPELAARLEARAQALSALAQRADPQEHDTTILDD